MNAFIQTDKPLRRIYIYKSGKACQYEVGNTELTEVNMQFENTSTPSAFTLTATN